MIKSIKALYEKYREIVNYVIAGGLTTLVSLGIYWGLTLTVFDPGNPLLLQAANVASWIGAVIFAYFINRSFVFRSENRNMVKEFTSFVLGRVGTLLMDMGSMFVMVTWLKWNDRLAKIIVQFIVLIGNYVISKFLVFRKKKDA
ncbi:MAG: GtrA family protein [Eubacterium sp.]|nr:GtrA family protein [Eubacterium sp.]MCR5292749.1 GtrA family protein [Eubacterium sp.]